MSAAKQAAAQAAVVLVQDGQRLGLGTGSTTALFIEALGRRIQEEGLDVCGVPTSFAAERLARAHCVPLVTLDEVDRLDQAFDGADEVDPEGNLIKGRGAAHTQEKVVAACADRFVVLVDDSKMVQELGTLMPVPCEVLPMATAPATRRLRALGARPVLRMGVHKDGPVVSDQGLWIIDAFFEDISDPEALETAIQRIPGVLENGLFTGLTTDVIIGTAKGTTDHRRVAP